MLNQSKEIIIQIGLILPDHPYRIFIIGGSESRETNVLLKLMKK